MLLNAIGVRSKAFKSAYDAQKRTSRRHVATWHRRVRMHTRCTGSTLKMHVGCAQNAHRSRLLRPYSSVYSHHPGSELSALPFALKISSRWWM